jgi:hypothetical protein
MNGYMWDFKRRHQQQMPKNVVPSVLIGDAPRNRRCRPNHERPMNSYASPAKTRKNCGSYGSGKSKSGSEQAEDILSDGEGEHDGESHGGDE